MIKLNLPADTKGSHVEVLKSNLSLPGPAAPGDTVSSSSNLSLPGPASANSGNTRPSRVSTLDLSLWLDEMNELMLMVQHLSNGSRYYSVIYTKFSVFKPVLKDNFSSLSSLLVAQNCAPEPDFHVLTGCKAWMLMSSCGKSPEMDDAEEGNKIHSTSTEGKNDSFPQKHSQGPEANNINLLLQKLNNVRKQLQHPTTLRGPSCTREGDMAMQIENGYAPPALTIKPVQGKTWKRAASKVCRLARESETTQVIPSPKHNKRTKEES
ncbi:50S ribosomal protein L9 [Striga asiatica]|uniref:50S ribosomal protein L9 n=1 Tax=Striga asiatica TaxID=4170 RepID=A0A5A7R023_STRAF|nr:50S ribosomal protein L9 [Striga asiatica]